MTDFPVSRVQMLEAALGGRSAVIAAYENKQPLIPGGGVGDVKTYTFAGPYDLPSSGAGVQTPVGWDPFPIDPIVGDTIFLLAMRGEFFIPSDGVVAEVFLNTSLPNGPTNLDPQIAGSWGANLTGISNGGNQLGNTWWTEMNGVGFNAFMPPGDSDFTLTTLVQDPVTQDFVSGVQVRNLIIKLVELG